MFKKKLQTETLNWERGVRLKRVLELIREGPNVRIEKGEDRESSRPDPYVHESVWVRVRHSRVSSICIPEVLLHYRSASFVPFVLLCSLQYHSLWDSTMLAYLVLSLSLRMPNNRVAYPGTG